MSSKRLREERTSNAFLVGEDIVSPAGEHWHLERVMALNDSGSLLVVAVWVRYSMVEERAND